MTNGHICFTFTVHEMLKTGKFPYAVMLLEIRHIFSVILTVHANAYMVAKNASMSTA